MNSANAPLNSIAIAAITRKGVALGRHLQELLTGSDLYLPEKFADCRKVNEYTFKPPAGKAIQNLFSRYRYLVLIMAVGAAMRILAPEIKSKYKDPGVVVVDEMGTFAVSLLSGHIGGANELAQQVAKLLSCQPVITTASEVSNTLSVDLLGKEFGWKLENSRNLTRVAASIVNGEHVGIYQDAGEKNWWNNSRTLPDNIHIYNHIEDLTASPCQAAILITDRILSKATKLPADNTLIYRPRSLTVGIGCNRGTCTDDIEKAVTGLFAKHKLSIASIRNIATIDIKKDETGILEFSDKYKLPVEYFDKEMLSRITTISPPSPTVLKHTGTPAVCEAAAILSSGNNSLIVPKYSYARMITLAVARLDFKKNEPTAKGKLFMVGLGPGAPEHMTQRTREALKASDMVVGYKNYVNLVEQFINGKEIISTGMTEEIKRAEIAIDSAVKGKTVSIISSGDSGIYGMAGLTGELLHQHNLAIDKEVVPGVPAMIASAALLGAPITSDFAAVSLSDYLVPWHQVSRRLELAAQADFVIAIYNPKSKRRQHRLNEAREIILKHRSPDTPVGIVTNAGREGQNVMITDLEHLPDHEVNMNTTVIIGNSTTFVFGDWMITPRGYLNKYHASKKKLP